MMIRALLVLVVVSMSAAGCSWGGDASAPSRTNTVATTPEAKPVGPTGDLEEWPISADAFGELQLGMTVNAARDALGVDLNTEGYDVDCQVVQLDEPYPPAKANLIFDDGKLSSVHVPVGEVATPEGIDFDSAAEEIARAYPDEVAVPDENVPEVVHYLIPGTSKESSLRIDFSSGMVDGFTLEPSGMPETCLG